MGGSGIFLCDVAKSGDGEVLDSEAADFHNFPGRCRIDGILILRGLAGTIGTEASGGTLDLFSLVAVEPFKLLSWELFCAVEVWLQDAHGVPICFGGIQADDGSLWHSAGEGRPVVCKDGCSSNVQLGMFFLSSEPGEKIIELI